MSVKLLNEHHLECLSLKGGYAGSFESTLVKMPHCWKSHMATQLCIGCLPHAISTTFKLKSNRDDLKSTHNFTLIYQ